MRVLNRFRIEYNFKQLDQNRINESRIWNLIKKAMIRYQSATKQFEDQQAVYSIEENLIGLLNDIVVEFNNPDGNNALMTCHES